MIDELKKYTVNVEFLANVFELTERTIQNYVLKGMPKTERGEYPFIDCLLWLVKEQKEIIAAMDKENPLTISRREAIELSNQRRRLEIQEKENTLVNKEQVEMAFVTIMKMLVRNADSIAPRLNKKLNGDAKALSTIREEIDEYKNLCANTPLNYFEDEFEQLNDTQS
jgi:phage terminase Nu1 subunit (DNA packaging protein)